MHSNLPLIQSLQLKIKAIIRGQEHDNYQVKSKLPRWIHEKGMIDNQKEQKQIRNTSIQIVLFINNTYKAHYLFLKLSLL